jgi:hypothetical protein
LQQGSPSNILRENAIFFLEYAGELRIIELRRESAKLPWYFLKTLCLASWN